MEKKELMSELKEKFDAMKKELGFKATLEELDETFFIKDAVLNAGFVSDKLSRQICGRIIENFQSWAVHLHTLIIPDPMNMIISNESKMLSEGERKEMFNLVGKLAGFASQSTLIGLTKDKKREAEFIDSSLAFWNKEFKPVMIRLIEKIEKGWRK